SPTGEERFLVIHLMIAGRLRWRPAAAAGKAPGISRRLVLAAFEFEHGTLFFTEASSKKRASMQLVSGRAAVRALDPGGVDARDVDRLDRSPARADEGWLPGKGDSVPAGDGRSRPISGAVSRVQRANPAHRLRRE